MTSRKTKVFCLILMSLLIVLCINFLSLKSFSSAEGQVVSTAQLQEFFEFENAVIELNQNDTEGKELEDFDNENSSQFELKRLIVEGNLKNTYGARSHASYNDLHILSFDTEKETELAYHELLKDGSLNVTIDQYVECQSYAEKEFSYLSYKNWGAQAIDIGGYRQYLVDKSVNKEVVVVVLDTGLNTSHEMFKNRLLTDASGKIKGYSYFNSSYQYSYNNLAFDPDDTNKYSFEDDDSHGTHVAGIICDLTPKNVKILPIKISNPKNGNKSTSSIVMSAYIRVLNVYSSSYNVVCTNLSFSGAGKSSVSEKNTYNSKCYTPLKQKNILPVTAAGNDLKENNIEGLDAVVVSALKENLSEYEFDHSYSNFGKIIDISAPGSSIYSAVINSSDGPAPTKYARFSGTSMASPQVAGVVALLYLNPSLETGFTASNIEQQLYDYSLDLGAPGKDDYYGHGMLNIKYFDVEEGETLSFYMDDVLKEGYLNYEQYDDSFELNIKCSNSQFKILYTTNKSIPKYATSKKFDKPITISQTTFLYVIGVRFKNNKIVERTKLYNISFFSKLTPIEDCFTIDSDGTVTKYIGHFKDLKIPETINGIQVKNLSPRLFKKTELERVELPTTCTTIAGYVFQYCKNLRYVYAPSVTKLYIAAFNSCGIPFVTDQHPSQDAKEGCYLPSLVETISHTFGGCFNLESVNLTKLTYSTGGANDFIECKKLKEVNLPNIITIPSYLLYNCTGLEKFTIPKNVALIGDMAFSYSGIKDLSVEEGNNYFNTDSIALYSKTALLFISSAFKGDYTVLDKININGADYAINTLGQGVLRNGDLNSLTIPESIENLDRYFIADTKINYFYYNAKRCKSDLYWDRDARIVYSPFGGAVISNLVIGESAEFVPERLFQSANPINVIIKSLQTEFGEGSLYMQYNNSEIDCFDLYIETDEEVTVDWLKGLQEAGVYSINLRAFFTRNQFPARYTSCYGNYKYIGKDNVYFVYCRGGGMVKTSVSGQGSISPSGEVAVLQNSSKTFEIKPKDGYFIKDVQVNGESVGAVTSYTFTNISGGQTIHAEFEKIVYYYKIEIVHNEGGSVSPASGVKVKEGDSKTINITVFEGYFIVDVKIDGVSKGSVSQYTFENMSGDHTVEVTFAKFQFTINAFSDAFGTITPNGELNVYYGGNVTYKFAPSKGYEVDKVLVDGVNKGSLNSYTFKKVVENHEIYVSYKKIIYKITASCIGNGEISPEGESLLTFDQTLTYTITPLEGYKIKDVKINDQSIGVKESYTFANLESDQTITALFEIKTYEISIKIDGKGNLSSSQNLEAVKHGDNVLLIVSGYDNWYISNVLVNGEELEVSENEIVLENVTEDMTVKAVFKENKASKTTVIIIICSTVAFAVVMTTLLSISIWRRRNRWFV